MSMPMSECDSSLDASMGSFDDEAWPDPPRKVCVAGNIGAGKSTLTRLLSQHLNFFECTEPSDENPYLGEFYHDKTLAFKCQIAFLASRFTNNKSVMSQMRPQDGVVQDRGPYEDVIFARMLHESGDIDQRDYETYLRLFSTLVSNLGDDIPDVILWLDVSIDELMRRISERGRDFEKGKSGVTREYLMQLEKQYQIFAQDMGERVPVYRVDWNTFQSTSELWGRVLAQYDGKPGLRDLE